MRSLFLQLYLLKVPRFLGIQSKEFSLPSFQPPTTDHHNRGPPSATFSAFNTAITTVRWRHSPSNPTDLQSNARILRWSDGSLTLQLASDPKTQYEIESKPLAPPQRNPPKPTPTSVRDFGKKRQANGTGYNAAQDSFTYLVAPHESVQMLRVTNKITAGLNILPTAGTADDALERLQNSLAKAAARGREDEADGVMLVNINEDPELAKRRAEAAEREKVKQQRAREKHEMRDRERAGRGYGRSGLMRAGGLTIGALEDDDGSERRSRPKARRPRRHEDWSDEEDYQRGKTREDEYDEEDDFIAASDEEEEIVDDDDDDDDIDDGIVEEPRRRDKDSPSKKRGSEGGDEEDAGAGGSRIKRRRVVDEDDEDE
jgi:RNA polymerase-associated protein LEO1